MMKRVRDLIGIVALVVLTLGGVGLFGTGDPPEPTDLAGESTPTDATPADPAAASGPVQVPEPGSVETRGFELRSGDTLVDALQRAGLDLRTGHAIAVALREGGVNLRRLKPGELIEVTVAAAGEPQAVRWQPSPWLAYTVTPGENGWVASREETEPDVRVEIVAGSVERSLFEAVEATGETAQLVLAIAGIFEWELDFTADPRTGDRFRLLVEKRYADGAFVEYGRVLAAQYLNDGRLITGVGYDPRDGRFQYYDLEGRSLRKSFLKSPLAFTRITSRFTYARPHPILGGTMPHRAVDYAAPMGTAVRAVADGVVTKAGWDGGYGIAVVLRHRSGYGTLYAHLSRLGPGIRAGARVNQRQVIGYVGSTGMSTGPHLHYEVIKNGRRVNPLGEKFIPGEPIAPKERPAFQAHAATLVERLEGEAPF